MSMRFVFVGLSITSSWGNGHATTYRGLLRALDALGHEVTFLERDMPWYQGRRDLPDPPYARTSLYGSLQELEDDHAKSIEEADVVVVGSYVPDGPRVAQWVLEEARGVVLFYDIDTPLTLSMLEKDDCTYLTKELVPRFHGYLSFTGGPTLKRLEEEFHAREAHALYCSVEPQDYPPGEAGEEAYTLGYLGTYSEDRQPGLEALLLEPARKLPRQAFVVAGPKYPEKIDWPQNVERLEHVPPAEHPRFYQRQKFTLNLTRRTMRQAGYAPSVRLFEAASTATAIISDRWAGMEEFFEPEQEILLVDDASDVMEHLDMDESRRRRIGERARRRVLEEHTPLHRAKQLVSIATPMLERGVRSV